MAKTRTQTSVFKDTKGLAEEKFLTARKASERWGIKETSIRWWIFQGLLPVYRIGRTVLFKERDFLDFLDRHRQETKVFGDAIR